MWESKQLNKIRKIQESFTMIAKKINSLIIKLFFWSYLNLVNNLWNLKSKKYYNNLYKINKKWQITNNFTNNPINPQSKYIQIQKYSISIKNKHKNKYIPFLCNQVSNKSHNKHQIYITSIGKSLKLLLLFLYLSYF